MKAKILTWAKKHKEWRVTKHLNSSQDVWRENRHSWVQRFGHGIKSLDSVKNHIQDKILLDCSSTDFISQKSGSFPSPWLSHNLLIEKQLIKKYGMLLNVCILPVSASLLDIWARIAGSHHMALTHPFSGTERSAAPFVSPVMSSMVIISLHAAPLRTWREASLLEVPSCYQWLPCTISSSVCLLQGSLWLWDSPNKFILKGHFVLVLFYRHALLLTSSNTRDLFDEWSMKLYGRSDKVGGEERRENKENASCSLHMWATDAYVLEEIWGAVQARGQDCLVWGDLRFSVPVTVSPWVGVSLRGNKFLTFLASKMRRF